MNQYKNNKDLYNAADKGDNETISLLLKSGNVDVNYQHKVWILFDLIFGL
jgi:hypothetical protein